MPGTNQEELRYWRTTAEITRLGQKGMVLVKVHGWDLSQQPTPVPISDLPPETNIRTPGTTLLVSVAEGPGGVLVMKDWEAVPPPIDESELNHTP